MPVSIRAIELVPLQGFARIAVVLGRTSWIDADYVFRENFGNPYVDADSSDLVIARHWRV